MVETMFNTCKLQNMMRMKHVDTSTWVLEFFSFDVVDDAAVAVVIAAESHGDGA